MNQLDKNLKRKYSLSEHSPDWPLRFSVIKGFLSEVFKDKAVSIEHVGSTAVAGMVAKPIIDVLVVVKKMESFEEQKELMVNAGYEWGENYIAPNTLLFFKMRSDGEKLENIHVCEADAPKARQFIVMRDYLRLHPEKVKEYSDLKKENAKRYPDDYPAYREAKAPFLEKLETEAYEWNNIVKSSVG
jgi:GrpB-like predicted nucleotidyltransferase (UPF0157 family)